MKFENIPNWTFEVEETSMSVFKISAVHNDGRSIEKTSNDPEATLEEVKRDALEMDAQS